MNSKITLPRLVAALAARRGVSKRQSEEFLKALFATVADALVERDTVKIKGLGTFKVSRVDSRKSVNVSTGEDHEIPAHDKVVFVPDKELAAAVNAPFEMFETVELVDAVDENDLELAAEADVAELVTEEASDDDSASESESATEAGEAGIAPDDTQEVPEPESEPESEEESEEAASATAEPVPGDVAEEDSVATGLYSAIEDDPLPSSSLRESGKHDGAYMDDPVPVCVEEPAVVADAPKRHRFGKGFIIGFLSACVLMAIGFGVLYVVITRKIDNMLSYDRGIAAVATVDSVALSEPEAISGDTTVLSAPAAAVENTAADGLADGVAEPGPDTKASDQPRYDTVTTTRYLITMARDYYGDHRFWPYIYKENEAKLGHPNRIRPGTRVVIPDLAKYGVDPSNPADVKKAIQLDREIYKRFQK